MSNQHHDPLEAAKITEAKRGPGRSPNIAPKPPEKAPDVRPEGREFVPLKAQAQEEVHAPESAPTPHAPEAPAEERLRSFRVLESRTLSWGGNVTQLSVGSVITEGGYGKKGIQQIIDQGVKLQELF